jgi:hypothetical protein
MQIITAEQQHSKWSLVRTVISDTLETAVLTVFDASTTDCNQHFLQTRTPDLLDDKQLRI